MLLLKRDSEFVQFVLIVVVSVVVVVDALMLLEKVKFNGDCTVISQPRDTGGEDREFVVSLYSGGSVS